MPKTMLTAKEVMNRFKISRQTLSRAINDGSLPKRNWNGGKKLFFYEEEIVALFSENEKNDNHDENIKR